MKTIDQVAVLVHGTDKSDETPALAFRANPSTFLSPGIASKVVPLDWWNDSDRDFGYEWIMRIILDRETGKLFGDGKGALPLVMERVPWNSSIWIKHDL